MTTSGPPRELHVQRARLGLELRRIRMRAGLSGRELATAAGLSQSAVSRVENGTASISLPEVRAWAEAAGVPTAELTRLEDLTEAAVNEVVAHREWLYGGSDAIQETVQNLEATTRQLRNFQPGLVPGLLQTAAYARHIFALGSTADSGDIGQAVAARMRRQAILHDTSRAFEFILTEAALRFRPAAPAGVWAGQLDHLAAVATTETITFGVIPADAEMHALTRCGFILYENRDDGRPPFAVVETPHAALYASDPPDVAVYRRELERFRKSAVFGDDALALVRSIAHP